MILLGILFLLLFGSWVVFIMYVVKTEERIERLERRSNIHEGSIELLMAYRKSRIEQRVRRNALR